MIRLTGILFLFVLCNICYATDGLSKETWEELTKEIDYTETYSEFQKDTTEKRNEIHFSPREIRNPQTLKIFVLILIGAILLALVVILIISLSKANITTSVRTKIAIEEIDDPSQHQLSDLEKFLLEATEAGDYRLALRIQFLILIKALNDSEIITWKKEKTNTDYYYELINKPFHANYKVIVTMFEKSWYANYPVNSNTYSELSKKFNNIKESIKQ